MNVNVKSMLVPEAPDRNFVRLTKTNDRKKKKEGKNFSLNEAHWIDHHPYDVITHCPR